MWRGVARPVPGPCVAATRGDRPSAMLPRRDGWSVARRVVASDGPEGGAAVQGAAAGRPRSRKDLEQVAQISDEVDLPAGRVLMKQGGYGSEFFVIISGNVRRRARRAGLARARGGRLPRGARAARQHRPHRDRDLLDDGRFLVLGHREFNSLLTQYPHIQATVLHAVGPADGAAGARPATLRPDARNAERGRRRASAAQRRVPAQRRQSPVLTPSVRPTLVAMRAAIGRRARARSRRRLVRAGLGEDQAADRPVGEDERTAAVAALDLGAEFEDVAADGRVAVDVAAGRGVGAGHGGRHDGQVAATRIAERRPDRAALGVRVAANGSGSRGRSGAVEQGDVERRIEQDDRRIGLVAVGGRDPNAAPRRAPATTWALVTT